MDKVNLTRAIQENNKENNIDIPNQIGVIESVKNEVQKTPLLK